MSDPHDANRIDTYNVRVYLDHADDPQIYIDVKHVWWKNQGGVLAILQTFPDGSHRYVYWLRERIIWYQVTPSRFAAQEIGQ